MDVDAIFFQLLFQEIQCSPGNAYAAGCSHRPGAVESGHGALEALRFFRISGITQHVFKRHPTILQDNHGGIAGPHPELFFLSRDLETRCACFYNKESHALAAQGGIDGCPDDHDSVGIDHGCFCRGNEEFLPIQYPAVAILYGPGTYSRRIGTAVGFCQSHAGPGDFFSVEALQKAFCLFLGPRSQYRGAAQSWPWKAEVKSLIPPCQCFQSVYLVHERLLKIHRSREQTSQFIAGFIPDKFCKIPGHFMFVLVVVAGVRANLFARDFFRVFSLFSDFFRHLKADHVSVSWRAYIIVIPSKTANPHALRSQSSTGNSRMNP